jgi:gliding motility-associated-like protein
MLSENTIWLLKRQLMRTFFLCCISIFMVQSMVANNTPGMNNATTLPKQTHALSERPGFDSLASLLAPTLLVSNDLCGQGIGSINLTPDPNTSGPYFFLWSNGETTEDISNLEPGVYGVTIVDGNGVPQQASAVVQAGPNIAPLSITGIVSGNTLCGGTGNGAIDLTVTPDPNVFTYEWSSGQTTMDITGLDGGIYTVSVTYGVTCTTTSTFVVPNNNNAPVVMGVMVRPDACELSDGQAGANAGGGALPYTYEWSNGGSSPLEVGLAAGTYTVTVTGADGCSATTSVTIPPTEYVVNIATGTTVANTTCNGSNGSVSITVTPSGPTYTYLWSNGATTQNLTNVPSGSYRVTVTRAGTCTATDVFYVENEPVLPGLAFTNTSASCGLSNGSVNLTTLPGGIAPFTYVWSNGQTSQDLNNVAAGNYDVTITSNNGCTSTATTTVEDNPVLFGYNGAVTDNFSCITNNGKIVLSLFPSNLGYQWSTGATGTTLNNLAPGEYTVTISAGGTCTAVETYLVGNIVEYPSIPAAPTASTCGLPNGAVDLTVNGGLAPFTYQWSNDSTTQDLSQLMADTFFVTVTSAAGCAAENMVIVPNINTAIDIQSNVSDNISCTAPSGFIHLNLAPQDTSYNILWSNGLTNDSLQNLSAGTYAVTVTLGIACIAADTFTLADLATPPLLSNVATAASCSLSNGAIDLTISSGAGPFLYTWSNTATTEDLAGLPPGNYSVTVTGANACTTVSAIGVPNNDIAPNISSTPTANTSCVAANGALDIAVAPAGNYTFVWSNSMATEDVSNLVAGNYTVTVSAGSCVSSATFIVVDGTEAPVVTPDITAAICSANNGNIDLSVSGTASPFDYLWSNGLTTEDLGSLLPGNYTVTVTAANGCTTSATYNVPNNASTFSLAGAAAALTNCAANNGAIDLTISPAGMFAIEWSNGATTEDVSGLAPGTYTVSVTEMGSCTASATFFVLDERTQPLAAPAATPELCGLLDGGISLAITGGTGPFLYNWDNGATGQDLVNVAAGIYAVTVTDANGCTTTASATVPANSLLISVNGSAAANTSCTNATGSIDLTVTPAGSYTYSWSNAGNVEDINSLSAGNYTVTVSAGGTCTSTALFVVDDVTPAPLVDEVVAPAFCGQATGAIDVTASGSPAPFDYQWSNSSSLEDQTNLLPGNYSVVVTAANGCTTTLAVTVPEDVVTPVITGTPTDATSCVVTNGAIDLTVSPVLPYTFQWSNSGATEDLTGLAAGSYTVTVSAGGSCTSTAMLLVNSSTGVVTLGATAGNVACFGENTGTASVVVNTGTAPYTYNWSVPVSGNPNVLNGLAAGNYTVTVVDNNGCTSTQTFAIAQPASALSLQCAATTPVSEPGFSDGAGAVTIAGGTGPYTVQWDSGNAPNPVPAGTFAINNLTESTYGVTVTDGQGCPAICNFTIDVASCATAVGAMSSTLVSICGPGCATAVYNNAGQILGPNDGLQFVLHQGSGAQITGEIARASQPSFCFNAATMTYGTTYYISAVAGVDDASGNVQLGGFCSVVAAGTPVQFIEKPVAASNTPAAITCVATQTAITGSSSLPGATFQWSTTNGQISGNTSQASITASAAGLYTLIINTNGCADTVSVSVVDIRNQPQANITTAAGTVLNCDITSLTVTGAATSVNSPVLQWFNNGGAAGSGNTLTVNAPGQLAFVVVDGQSFCADTALVTITQNTTLPPLAIAGAGVLTCATPTLTLAGSSTAAGVQLTWATIAGVDTTVLAGGNNLPITQPGTYYLLGSSTTNGCENGIFVTINANQTPPLVDAGNTFTLDCAGETASLQGSASVNATYQWSTVDGNLVSGGNTLSPLVDEPGTYTLLVTNPANGCTASDAVEILPEIPVAYASVMQPSCVETTGVIQIDSITGLSDPIVYSLNGGAATDQDVFDAVLPGNYTIVASGGNGCTAVVEVVVNAPLILDINLTPAASIALGYTYFIDAQVNVPPSSLETVQWTPAIGLSCDTCLATAANPFTSTRYELLVTTKDGCEDRTTIVITVDKTREIYVPNVFSPNGDGVNDFFNVFADPITVVKVKSLQVYSRWGEALYENRNFIPGDLTTGWDGTFKGATLNPGVFVWQAVVEFVDGVEQLFKGDVTIQR